MYVGYWIALIITLITNMIIIIACCVVAGESDRMMEILNEKEENTNGSWNDN